MPPPRSQARTAPPGPAAGDLRAVLEPVVAAAGFELDALDVRATGRRQTVRLVVDSDTGAGLDDIAKVSRAASEALDRQEHLVGGSYTLEVTSPGVDRPLTTPRHWRRAHLRLVRRPPRHVGDSVRRSGRPRGRRVRDPAGRRHRCATCGTPTSPTPRSRSSSPHRHEAEIAVLDPDAGSDDDGNAGEGSG